ncbi:hypothetical protein L0Y40_01845 [Candidatus Wolfebacteria bacterium]|nr:hypothetical protein [Candidatus Wolfebacteria bacterium]
MCDCEFDHCEFSRFREVKAKKRHACIDCRRPIHVGERHMYCVGRWSEAGFSSWRVCMDCYNLWDKVTELVPEQCICYGTLRSTIRELAEEGNLDGAEGVAIIRAWGEITQHLPLPPALPPPAPLLDDLPL